MSILQVTQLNLCNAQPDGYRTRYSTANGNTCNQQGMKCVGYVYIRVMTLHAVPGWPRPSLSVWQMLVDTWQSVIIWRQVVFNLVNCTRQHFLLFSLFPHHAERKRPGPP